MRLPAPVDLTANAGSSSSIEALARGTKLRIAGDGKRTTAGKLAAPKAFLPQPLRLEKPGAMSQTGSGLRLGLACPGSPGTPLVNAVAYAYNYIALD
ncbi:MAG: hypothetical protein M3463_04375 [Verrucomicrobiota bacterium]|nr:hypothetical protein [Verrucomicrobiota bacterium]